MTFEQAIKTLNDVMPPSNSNMVDPYLLPIANAWEVVNAEIKRLNNLIKELQYVVENQDLELEELNSKTIKCKVGDTVYYTDSVGDKIYEAKVKRIIYDLGLWLFDDSAINQSIFLTKIDVKLKCKALQEGKK